jgi:hypothetical protein
VNGHEEDSEPRNLIWTCRSCNVKSANTLRKAGLGRLTRQYNPAGGAETLGAWMNAVSSIKGEGGTMAIPKAVAMIHATSPAKRSEFANEIWRKRRERGTDKTGGKMRNAKRKKNFLGFGGAKATFSSKLMDQAYKAGYAGKGGQRSTTFFSDWYAKLSESERKTHHGSLKAKLRAQYEKGVREEHRDHLAGTKVKIQALKSEKRESPKPAKPEGKLKDENVDYRGVTIKRTTHGFDVKGEVWNNLKQAKEFADIYIASQGRAHSKARNRRRKRNAGDYSRVSAGNPKGKKSGNDSSVRSPTRTSSDVRSPTSTKTATKADTRGNVTVTGGAGAGATTSVTINKKNGKRRNSYSNRSAQVEAELTQGKAKAQIFEATSGKHTAQIIPANGSREEHTFNGPGSFKAAMSWARLRLHEVANPGTKFKLFKGPAKRKNPAEPAARMYEKFHGTPSEEVREYIEERHRHSWLAGLGPLISMDVVSVQGNKEVELTFPDPQDAAIGDVVMLCATEDGTQLIPVGGDQELPIKFLQEKFGMVQADFQRDNALIGTIKQITYRTKKSFEKNGEEEIDFFHALGSEGSRGVYPVLVYHPRDESLEIVGGRYYIGKAAASLGNTSPGIIG